MEGVFACPARPATFSPGMTQSYWKELSSRAQTKAAKLAVTIALQTCQCDMTAERPMWRRGGWNYSDAFRVWTTEVPNGVLCSAPR